MSQPWNQPKSARGRDWAIYPLAVLAVALIGCKPGAEAANIKKKPGAVASAAKVSPPNCSGVAALAAGPGGRVIDILGMRTGQTPEQALTAVRCNLPKVIIYPANEDDRTAMYNVPSLPDGKHSRTTLGGGTEQEIRDSFSAVLVGYPGEEVVSEVVRTLQYPAGQKPPYADMEKSVLGKYGQPHFINRLPSEPPNRKFFAWVYRPDGTPLPPSDPLFAVCAATDTPSATANGTVGLGDPRVARRCGPTLYVIIIQSPDNNSVVDEVGFSLFDGNLIVERAANATARIQAIREGGGHGAPKL